MSFPNQPVGFTVPEWAKKAVWYQIFPERFRNGNPENDPTLEDLRGAYPHDLSEPWQIHPWTSDWYKLQHYEQASGKNLWYNIQRRRYGGDLEGIIEKLEYLQDLGINALYLNPVFDAPSHHKYDGATYHHIDPNFGPDPAGDRSLILQEVPHDPETWVWTSADRLMLDLIAELHRLKIRIIFDGVFNHMGINSWVFRDVQKNQQNSRYRDWLKVKSWDDSNKNSKFNYNSWWGFPDLPELKQNKLGIVDEPKQYIFDATKRWMDPNDDGDPKDGIDGWRLDVAFCIKHPFWKDWRKHVKSINPDAYLTAEVIDSIEVLQPYLIGDEFDAVMNYNFAFACTEYFFAQSGSQKVSILDKRLRELRNAFAPEVAHVMQNLFDSHDSDRIASYIVNREWLQYRDWMMHHKDSKAVNPRYEIRKPSVEEIAIQKLMVIFQMTYVGAPMIYYGDEAGMWGANDPCCRKPMVWEDLDYEPEKHLPDGSQKEKQDDVVFNKNLFEHYKKLIQIRLSLIALQLGDYKTLLVDDKKQVYAFLRSYENKNVIVIVNTSDSLQRLNLAIRLNGFVQDVLNSNRLFVFSQSGLDVDVDPKWARILKVT